MSHVSRDEVREMVIELTLGVAKDDSQYANISESHAKRWDQIESQYTQAVSNVDTPDAFDPARTSTESGNS